MNYSILQATLQENFGLPRRIVRAHVLNLLKMPKPTLLASSLRHFYNALMGDIRSLESLNIDVAACAPFIVPIIEDKLPGKVLSSIGDYGKEVSFNLKGFIERLKTYITREEQAAGANWPSSPKASFATYEPPSTYSTLAAPVNVRCQLCKGSHATQHCPQSAADKTAAVISNNLCLNCLHPGHRALQCNAKGRCAKCKGKHYTAIHGIQIHSNAKNHNPQRHPNPSRQPPPPPAPQSAPTNAAATPTSSQPTASNCAFAVQRPSLFDTDAHKYVDSLKSVNSSDVVSTVVDNNDISQTTTAAMHETTTILLKTAKALAISADKKLMARIFFDEGSQRSYVPTAFATQLDLAPKKYEFLSVYGFGGKVLERSYGVTDIGLETPTGIENVRVLITDEIVQPLQQHCSQDLQSHPRFRDLPLANDFTDNSFTVDILLGADAAYRFLGNVSPASSHPVVQDSKFGYILSGPLFLNSKPPYESEPKDLDISLNTVNVHSSTSEYY